MSKADFDRTTTAAIKGIALILMFIHHFFSYPEWYVEGVAYPQLTAWIRFFRYSLKICVPVFAFLTGYFYVYARRKTLLYSLGKISDLLISYWVVFFPVLCFALLTGYRGLTVFGFLMGVIGRNIPLMTFCWYVSFYCMAMLLLPLLADRKRNAPLRETIIMVCLPIAVCAALETVIGSHTLRTMLEEIRLWFPCVASGYLCSKYNAFGKADQYLNGKKAWVCVLAYGGCIGIALAGRYLCDVLPVGVTLDLLYAPVFVYGLSRLLLRARRGCAMNVLQSIGQRSLMMWFIHCIFFNVSNEITQRILYAPVHPVLVVLFGLALCYAAACLLSPAANGLIHVKNRMLAKLCRMQA